MRRLGRPCIVVVVVVDVDVAGRERVENPGPEILMVVVLLIMVVMGMVGLTHAPGPQDQRCCCPGSRSHSREMMVRI